LVQGGAVAKRRTVKVWIVWWELPSRIVITNASSTFKLLYTSHKQYTPFLAAAKKLGWAAEHTKGIWTFNDGTTSCIFDGSVFRRIVGSKTDTENFYKEAMKFKNSMQPKDLSVAISRAIKVRLLGINMKTRSSCYLIPPPTTINAEDTYTLLEREVNAVGAWFKLETEVKRTELLEAIAPSIEKEYGVIQDNYTGPKQKEMLEAWKKKVELFGDLCDLDQRLVQDGLLLK
jgi:hypothetical protein